jgi:hypothetical protein
MRNFDIILKVVRTPAVSAGLIFPEYAEEKTDRKNPAFLP